MERHRSIWLYLDHHPEMLKAGMSIVHIAPEEVLRTRFNRIENVNYRGGDLTAEFGPLRIDVTNLPQGDSSVDAVVCNHVLEHVPDDAKAMREIRRVLKVGGWALLQIPDMEGDAELVTQEDPGLNDQEEQLRRFGQRDHVRRYGWDFVDRLGQAGFAVDIHRPEAFLPVDIIESCRLRKLGHVEPIFIARPR